MTPVVKTAISLPDDLCADVDACARRLKLSRSGLLALAVREYLTRHGAVSDATAAWNRALADTGPDDAATRRALGCYTRARVRRGGAW